MRDYSDMREVFLDEPLPALLASNKMWKDIELTPQPNGEAVEEWLEEMQKCYGNGTVFLKRFKLSPHPILHWVVSHNRVHGQYNPMIDDVGFFNDFVHRANIAELKLKESDKLSVPSSAHLSPYFLRWSDSRKLDAQWRLQAVRGHSPRSQTIRIARLRRAFWRTLG